MNLVAGGFQGSKAGGGSTLALEVNGTPNGDQALLNLAAGSNVTLTDNGTGTVTVATSGGGGGGGAITQIAQVVVSVATATINFGSIPGTFSSLMLIICADSSDAAANDNIDMQFNGDTTSGHYAYTFQFTEDNTGAATGAGSNSAAFAQIGGVTGATAAIHGSSIRTTIAGYAGTTFSKFINSESATTILTSGLEAIVEHFGAMWSQTAAINAIKLFLDSGSNFQPGTVATLYGLQ